MSENAPVRRITEFVSPTEAEWKLLRQLGDRRVEWRRDEVIRPAGAAVTGIFVLHDGWAISSLNVTDERQIVKVHFPGDILGAPSLALDRAAETLTALTPCVGGFIPTTDLLRLFIEAPRLGVALFLCAQQERIFLQDRIASIGRTSAAERVAAFLLHICERAADAQSGKQIILDIPLTQGQIADITGMTAVHMNRTLRSLALAGAIERDGRRFVINNIGQLRKLARLPQRSWATRPAWLEAVPHR